MAESIQHFALKTIGLSRCKGRKPCTLKEAARHNLREIQAELGAHGHIDPQRTTRNTTITGPATAGEVQALAEVLLAQVDTSRLKRDHVQAIEAVFSLPIGSDIDPAGYFTRCLQWAADTLRLPVLLATAHHDEAAPHMHVLMLPVRDGKHIGGAIMLRESLKRVRESFFNSVAGPAGLKREGAKVRGVVKQWACEAVLRVFEGVVLPDEVKQLWPVIKADIEREPTRYMLALGIDVNSLRPPGESPRQTPIGLDARAIGLQNMVQKDQALSCVGLPQVTTTAPATKPTPASVSTLGNAPPAIDTFGALWAAVGCRSNLTTAYKAERLRHAREAQQRAIDRHRSKPAPVLRAAAVIAFDDELTRERDEYAHDLSAWTD